MDATTQHKPQPGPRVNDPSTAPQTGPQEARPQDTYDPLQKILERARKGDQSVLPELKHVLDDNPSIWRDCYDLVAMSEQAWLDKMAGKDLLLSQSLRRHVEQLKLDLVGASPAPLEKLLADRIAAAWLAVHHAEMAEAFGDAGGSKVAQMRLKRLDAATKRFQTATKALAVARRLTNGLRIEINHTGTGSANQPTSGDNGSSDAVRERLRTMFNEDAALAEEKDLATGVRS
jgi:hypothetical protein